MAKLANIGDIVAHKQTNRCATVIGSTSKRLKLKYKESIQIHDFDSEIKELSDLELKMVIQHQELLHYSGRIFITTLKKS